ncbi:hypothetical protein [Clostridium tagluense]|uniref:Uncharacterized protein n=1 Tax=Clostridium tagluense TaxID=360422 RepID=A0A401UIJ1_9CLOT|nr:hypothetical protein [Clostridium tagluense]GCD09385.1 hypothetical protein Ctaglu_10080 [Clostridium tagluense]
MNVNPEKCIFIGDGGSDELKGAKELGIKCAVITHNIEQKSVKYCVIKKLKY